MNLKILEKSDKRLKISIEGADTGFANALRRIMMSEIPVMSVEIVEFEENNSGLFDETLAHRIGLIPIKFDRKMFNLKKDCKCDGKGCSRCQIKLIMEKEGPGMVKSADILVEGGSIQEKDIPIIDLLEKQRIKLEAYAELGFGRNHAKWQSAVIGFREEKNSHSFDIESVCGLTAMEILDSALEILEEKAENFLKESKKAIR